MKKRQWLLPFSLLYGAATAVRNFLYDAGFFKSVLFEKPVILVGNLSTGGTGKSP
ncbi:MAG: tetraacyldisaccharide 4'-kinase, partial [Bacteroidota bacterium]